jgi:hypothetical protein
MAAPRWLKEYYGKDFEKFQPTVVMEGRTQAVVKLTQSASRGYSGLGYVLVKKRGKHNASQHLVLHEGVASKEDLNTMKHVLSQKDGE